MHAIIIITFTVDRKKPLPIMAVPQLAIEYGTLRFILCMYFLSCSMVNMAVLFTALFIYWFLAVLIGTAGIANYFFLQVLHRHSSLLHCLFLVRSSNHKLMETHHAILIVSTAYCDSDERTWVWRYSVFDEAWVIAFNAHVDSRSFVCCTLRTGC